MKHLLPQVTQYFKANLHTHSTISDGQLTPEQLKAAYQAKGYQILSITDHNIIADHSNLSEPNFLMLTGIEVNHNHEAYRIRHDGPVYHLNLIAKRPDILWSPAMAYHRRPQSRVYEDLMECENMDMRYDPAAVNAVIAKANEMGFLVMYNHPTWSCQSYPDYAPLQGLWGMELQNGECCFVGNDDNNARVYTDLLKLGNRLFPLGTDDSHMPESVGLSWIMVGAERLSYDSVIQALEVGDFYMSCGPEIFKLTVDRNILSITCSGAKTIALESHGRFARRVSASGEELLQGASFDLTDFFAKDDGPDMYIRLTVTAPDGSYAATRAYYVSEL